MVLFLDEDDINTGNTLQRVNHIFFIILTVWVYNFVLTFGEGAEFILKTRWRIPTVFYLVCQCLPCAMIIVIGFLSLPGLPLRSCTIYSKLNTYLGGTVLLCAESLFMGRVWAMLSHTKRWKLIFAFCNFMFFLCTVMVTLTLYDSLSTILQSPIPTISSCYTGKTSYIVIFAFIILAIIETETLGFMLYHSWKMYRESGHIIPLLRILIKHNVLYFACGLFFTTLVVISIFTIPAAYFGVVSKLQITLHAILVTRMHRELWNAGNNYGVNSLSVEDVSTVAFARPLSGTYQLINL